jgi:GNAT superfamily N-acetyltransferase
MIELVLHPALQAQLTEVELLEIAMHKSVITRLQSLGFAADYQDSDGGTLFYCGQDSFLTQGIGIGAQETTASESEILNGIEAFYLKFQEPVNLEVGLHARIPFLQELARRGYVPVETSNVLFLYLENYEPNQLDIANLEITQIDGNIAGASKEYEVILQGFGLEVDAGNLEFQSTLYNSDNHYSFAIKNEERTIGGGSVFLHQDMAYLAGASVLTEFRGFGAHKQLLNHRLTFAKEMGMKKVYVITPVASASEYNMYKLGFKLLGARVKWSKG